MVIYIVKSLKTLSLEKLIMKCRNDTYEELTDIDLIEKCHHGQLLQNCATNNEFICDSSLEHENSRYEEIKITDLSPYCLIGTFLQSCEQKNYLLCECKKWGQNSQKEHVCDFCLFDRDMKMFSYDFFDLDKSSKIPKISHTFILF